MVATNVQRALRGLGREWLVGLASYALLVAPFGCQLQSSLLGDPNSNTDSTSPPQTGLFLNQDTTSLLIVAGRNSAGDAFFVYGTRQSNGAVGEVQSIRVQTADGSSSFILFELGRPTHVQGPDGSYVHVTYHAVTLPHLSATAVVHDAASGINQSVDLGVDLQQTAEQVAAAVQQLTGQTLAVPDTPAISTVKVADRAVGPLLQLLVVLPMLALSQYLIVVMGQVLEVVYAAVAIALQAVVLAAFAPLFLFAALLSDVTIHVESLPLVNVFIELPPPPHIDVVIG